MSVKDVGRIVVNILLRPKAHLCRTLHLTAERLTLQQMTDVFNKHFTDRKFICPKVSMNSYTSTKSWRGYISLQFVCVCICVCVLVCVCVYLSVSEQNSSRTDWPIWTRFSLNGCLPHWLEPYRNYWLWFKGQGQSTVLSIFFFIILC